MHNQTSAAVDSSGSEIEKIKYRFHHTPLSTLVPRFHSTPVGGAIAPVRRFTNRHKDQRKKHRGIPDYGVLSWSAFGIAVE